MRGPIGRWNCEWVDGLNGFIYSHFPHTHARAEQRTRNPTKKKKKTVQIQMAHCWFKLNANVKWKTSCAVSHATASKMLVQSSGASEKPNCSPAPSSTFFAECAYLWPNSRNNNNHELKPLENMNCATRMTFSVRKNCMRCKMMAEKWRHRCQNGCKSFLTTATKVSGGIKIAASPNDEKLFEFQFGLILLSLRVLRVNDDSQIGWNEISQSARWSADSERLKCVVNRRRMKRRRI